MPFLKSGTYVAVEPGTVPMNEEWISKGCFEGNRIARKRLGIPTRETHARNIVQLCRYQPVNWSTVYYRFRERLFNKTLGKIPYTFRRKYKKIFNFLRVWVFVLKS